MESYTVGLDVHSKTSTFEVQDSTGRTVGRGEVTTDAAGLRELKERFALPAGTRVGLETGTVAFYVARELSKLSLEPVVIDAHEVRRKAHRPNQKSDGRDAAEVCGGVRAGYYRSVVHVPPGDVARLREALSRRRHFVRTQTSEINSAKRLLRSSGLGHLSRDLRTERGWSRLMAAVSDPQLRIYLECHEAVWRSAGEQVARLDRELEEASEPFGRALELLRTVPGVGPIVSMTTVAVLSDTSRFPTAKHVASYAGLVPTTYQSGARDAHGRITKRGSGELRSMLCEAAQQARRPDHPLHPYFSKVCAKRGYKQAVIAVAHRLCRILWAMLRTGQPFDPLKAGVERGPFEHKTKKVYRLAPRDRRAASAGSARDVR